MGILRFPAEIMAVDNVVEKLLVAAGL